LGKKKKENQAPHQSWGFEKTQTPKKVRFEQKNGRDHTGKKMSKRRGGANPLDAKKKKKWHAPERNRLNKKREETAL